MMFNDDESRPIYIDELLMQERYIFDVDDIYYNKDKFDSGEINLCFITGLCGSGKSTMANDMESTGIESYELDDVVDNIYKFSMSNFKQYGDLIYSFFNGVGREFYTKNYSGNDYDKKLINAFVDYSIQYANSHRSTRFVINGIQLIFFVEPSKLKDYAVYIKGTSAIKSAYRASKRDGADKGKNDTEFDIWKRVAKRSKHIPGNENLINTWRQYFSKAMEESVVEESCKDLKTARKFVTDVGKLAKKYDANFFLVTDGASGYSNTGNEAVRNARNAQIEWEKEHGFDPDEDWSKSAITESKRDALPFIIELNKMLNEYEYGIAGLNTCTYNNFVYDWKLQSPKEFERNKVGVCWDYVIYQSEVLRKAGIKHTNYYAILPDTPHQGTHTFTIAKDGSDYIYLESSFKNIAGVYVSKNLDDLLNFIVHSMVIYGEEPTKNQRYVITQFSEYNKYGVGCIEFMQDMASMKSYGSGLMRLNYKPNVAPVYASSSNTIYQNIGVSEAADDFEEPDEESNALVDVKDLLDSTDPKKIYLTSDWHYFKNHYKKEINYVNTQKITTWCRQNIKDDDVFMYLGDISFRYANAKDKAESQRLLASIPGKKILILGNHDIMAGADYFTGCGFDYVFESLEWNGILFTHKPIAMDQQPDEELLNIHGHIHNLKEYNTTDGKRNINVYPLFYDNKPVTLDYILKHKEELVKDNKRSDWIGMGESYDFLRGNDTSLGTLKQLVTESARSDIAANVLYSPTVNSQTIAYMVDVFKDHLKGNVAIKLHVGEEGNENWLSPRLITGIAKQYRATLVDSNVFYESIKQTTEGHIKVAKKHGFTDVANFDVLDQEGDIELSIPAENRIKKALNGDPDSGLGIPSISKGPHLKSINVGSHLDRYDSMIVYTHFKGHEMAGFGGSIKNIGMGIPSGKVGKAQVHNNGFEWGPDFLERLVESASAIEDYFDGNVVYVNVLQNISTKCDCDKDAPKSKMPNIGVLVSDDIVAIEQASIDFIRNCRGNKEVLEAIASRGGMHQIEYAEWLGMGNRKYKLYDINNNRIKLEASYVNEMKRSNLPDSAFGIPEDRKYPLDTEQHVRSAIKLFGHAEESKKKSLAHRIKSAASKYDITIPENTQCYKYLTEAAMEVIPSGVKNIVFDLGGVIIDGRLMDALSVDPNIPNDRVKEIFDLMTSKMITNSDPKTHAMLHICDVDEAMAYFTSIAPKYIKPYIKPIFSNYLKSMATYDYVDDLLVTLRSKGYNIYYLSNWNKFSYDLEKPFFDRLIGKFDGGLFSFEVDMEKPDERIYEAFLQKFNLNAEECMFFDDKQENVEAAKSVGMNSVVFDPATTPYDILGYLDIQFSEVGDKLLAITDDSMTSVNLDDLTWWYVCNNKHPSDIDEELYYKTLQDAVNAYTKDCEFMDYPVVQKYVFTCNGDRDCDDALRLIPLGRIAVHGDRHYDWQIQYPLKIQNNKYVSCLEWAMASCNPIQGISKPFILKVGSECGGTIDTTQYAFSPDIIADKYLVVNENAQLEMVDASYFSNRYVEEYEYVGNRFNLKKISEAYKKHSTVDNTFFYTALTGKAMLSEDQIDFDKRFKKVDFELLKEKQLSTMATQRDEILEAMGYKTSKLPIEESFIMHNVPFMKKYNKHNEFCIKEDFDGYYFYNLISGKRTASVIKSDLLTEAMIKSIL